MQEDAGDRFETFVQHVAAVLIFGDDVAGVRLAEGVDSDGDELRQSGRREPALRHPIARVIHLGISRDEGAEADSARAVAFGETVDDNHELFRPFQLQRADRLSTVVHELAIDLVRDEEESMLAAEVGDHVQLFAAVDGAGRIVGIAENHQTRAGRQRAVPHLTLGQMETILAAAGDRNDVESGHRGERFVVRIERLDDHHVVAFVRAGHEREEDCLAAARGRENLIQAQGQTKTAFVVRSQGLKEPWGAGRRRVGQHAILDLLQAIEHACRRFDVRLPDVEVIHLRAARLRRLGQRHEFANRRRRHEVRPPR